jgi:hypothetical protein
VPDPIQLALDAPCLRLDGIQAGVGRGPMTVELGCDFATPADDGLILACPRLIEEPPELLVGERLDLVDVQEAGAQLLKSNT